MSLEAFYVVAGSAYLYGHFCGYTSGNREREGKKIGGHLSWSFSFAGSMVLVGVAIFIVQAVIA